MKITYFGEIADLTSKSEEFVEEITNSEFLIKYLTNQYQIQNTDYQIAVNHKLIDKNNSVEIKENDEVAILSPFAGG